MIYIKNLRSIGIFWLTQKIGLNSYVCTSDEEGITVKEKHSMNLCLWQKFILSLHFWSNSDPMSLYLPWLIITAPVHIRIDLFTTRQKAHHLHEQA